MSSTAKRKCILTVLPFIFSCCISTTHAEQVEDTNLHFSLTIPEGFVRDPQLAGARPDFVHAFRKAEQQDMGVVIIVERMRGTIAPERLDIKQIPPGFSGKLLTVKWHDFDLDALEVPEEVNGLETINYNVQVPLKPEAIQIRVLGRRD